ncbi:MAG: GNAT family N-acetyltransferase [Gemmatimonadales bacterium]
MTDFTIRRLGPDDEPILATLALREAEFDLAGRSERLDPLDAAAARAYLANPAVLHWVAWDDTAVVGFLLCHVLPLRSQSGRELLLYEIGVHAGARRRGIGRRLLAVMESWMREQGVHEVWVCADNPDAEAFYRACGFVAAGDQPVYMTRQLAT